jgi:dihydrofolate synthase/folylpolyglutamate synthase
MLESILMRSGLKVGFYSSPHLVRFTERYRVNRKEIPKKILAGITAELQKNIDPDNAPGFFEAATVIGLVYFARKNTDIAIMEVGMGGRLDATNVIRPVVSLITNITLEHQRFLGTRLLDIAGEKAGIIKRDVDLVTAATQPSVIRLFRATCERRRARFWRIGEDVCYRTIRSKLNYYGLRHTFRGLELSLKGRFQYRNAALALAAVEILERKGFEISSRDIKEGLADTFWPGRVHIVSRDPIIVLDGAHNPAGIRGLAETIKKDFTFRRMILVLGVMEDKDIRSMVQRLVPLADHIIYGKPKHARSADPEILMREAPPLGEKKGEIVPILAEAVERAKKIATKRDLILITGSLFTVGEVMPLFDTK